MSKGAVKKTSGDIFLEKIKEKKYVILLFSVGTYLAFFSLESVVHSQGDAPSGALVFLAHLMRDISISLLVAFVLLIAIESDHRKHLDDSFEEKLERLSESVFRGVFNSDLPKSYISRLVDDMMKIKIVREGVSVDYTIKDHREVVAGESLHFVTLQADLAYTTRNISCEPIMHDVSVGLPNPVLEELKRHVKIVDVKVDGQSVAQDNHHKELKYKLQEDGRDIAIKFCQIPINPGEVVHVKMTYIMAKEIEDTEILRTSQAADAIQVAVFDRTTGGMSVGADAIHKGLIEKITGDNPEAFVHRWKTKGYLLPWQGVILYWKLRPKALKLSSEQPTEPESVEPLKDAAPV